ncbi:hemin uptake protein HemP [Undibacterium sp. LX40W]|uniref:Hemin uptake protein HemP n=1 Tax=Undibacterium nitidum TaxID=2762298 RepID=A0A923HI75_9BURK|nr:hemin uptake protein HemP [Undibacterium nitidum]MBC3880240.1 hemin uptake protein HemP [Undibacterium nitidum]MBC3891024.1 hemin uptake protein HemP [Undibacterium sp. LX40W]
MDIQDHQSPEPILLKTKRNDGTSLRHSSKDILQGFKEIEIEHQGSIYRLRCTSLGKLILTK